MNYEEKLEKEIQEIEKSIPEKIDTSLFSPLSLDDLAEILDLTIKHDKSNKIITFLCQLSAYTENSQFNISFNAPSSTGKSYIPLEISNLFPKEDVLELGNCSPTAFFHEHKENYDKETNTITVDLSRKIIIFLDQPNPALLERLRSLLSHDRKEMQSKITDKNQKGGNRTKTVIIKGFPSVIFCSAGLVIDEQESTRFLLLSPDTTQEKIKESILSAIKKGTDNKKYQQWLNNDPKRRLLINRIKSIKNEEIDEIIIPDSKYIEELFFADGKKNKSRNQRDIKWLISIIKSLTILNMWWRKRDDKTIIANKEDIDNAFLLWKNLSISQELNIPPYVYGIYKDVFIPAIKESGEGVGRQEISKKHFETKGCLLNDWILRRQIIPMLESAGLIRQEQSPDDKRKMLIFSNENI
jgi:hypothetical protein